MKTTIRLGRIVLLCVIGCVVSTASLAAERAAEQELQLIPPHKPPATLVRTNQAPPFLTSTKRKRVCPCQQVRTHSLALRACIFFRPLLGAFLIPPAMPVVGDLVLRAPVP